MNIDLIKYWDKKASESPGFKQSDYWNNSSFNRIKTMIDEYNLDGFEHLLDAGCGSGIITNIIAHKGKKVTVLDHSKKMINLAKENIKHEDVDFVTSTIEQMPFDDNTFDVAISIGVLQLLDPPDLFAKELLRVVRPGGKIILFTTNKYFPIRMIYELFPNKINQSSYSLRTLKRLFKEAAFESVQVVPISPFDKPKWLRAFFEWLFSFHILAPSFAIELRIKDTND